ncbi:MAG: hypothetical protein QOD60_1596 [Solirubrobacterales bacterium]|jgi:hypothetical protein|nr:hypothetical protein [Solirubrobacterales bacterium]
MTIALILVLNVAAATGLLALLAAAMRLPHKLPAGPSGRAIRRVESRWRRRKTEPASRPSREKRGAPEPIYSR